MSPSPSAESKKPRPRPLPLAALATGLTIAVLAPPPIIAEEVLDTQALGAVRLSTPAELALPAEAPAEPERTAPVDTASDEPDIEADAALPEPAAGPADPATTAPEVTVRAGSHPSFQRFVFDWPHEVAVVTEQTGDDAVVRFAAPARFRPDGSVPAGQLEVQEPGTVTLSADGVVEVKSFSLADHRVVVDLYTTRPETRR